ncbi:MAG: ABC transporter permease [Actinomycetota bacterium]|nr:ABC transporter permease [Actinomycetota bacterium]
MNALLRAEARKIVTSRSTLLIAGFVVVYPALSLLPAVFAPQEPAVDGSTILQVLRGGADVLTLAALVLGILAVAGEHRHGTIVPALLASPRRGRFLAAKLGSQAALGMVLALAVAAVGLTVGTSYLTTRNVSVDLLSSDVLLTLSAVTLVVTLYAVIGAAVGALVKNQTAAVAGALVWVFAVENAVPLVLGSPGLNRWLPGGLSDRLLQVADPVAGGANEWTALALFVGVAVVLAAGALVAIKAADFR